MHLVGMAQDAGPDASKSFRACGAGARFGAMRPPTLPADQIHTCCVADPARSAENSTRRPNRFFLYGNSTAMA